MLGLAFWLSQHPMRCWDADRKLMCVSVASRTTSFMVSTFWNWFFASVPLVHVPWHPFQAEPFWPDSGVLPGVAGNHTVAQVSWRAIGWNSICFWWPVQQWILFWKRSLAEMNRWVPDELYRFQHKTSQLRLPVEMSWKIRSVKVFDSTSPHTEWPSCSKDCYWCWVSEAGDAAWRPGFSALFLGDLWPSSNLMKHRSCLRHGATKLTWRLTSCSDWATGPAGSAK